MTSRRTFIGLGVVAVCACAAAPVSLAQTPGKARMFSVVPSLDTPVCSIQTKKFADELAGLEFLHARELERVVREGAYHTGLASVVQLLARRRTAD